MGVSTEVTLPSGSSEEVRVGSNPVTCTRKRLRIGYNPESFSTKSDRTRNKSTNVDEIATR